MDPAHSVSHPLSVHAQVEWTRGMCSDEESHVAIDRRLARISDMVRDLEAERDRLRASHDSLEASSRDKIKGLLAERDRLREAARKVISLYMADVDMENAISELETAAGLTQQGGS